MADRRIFRTAYFRDGKVDHEFFLNDLRDSDAYVEVSQLLHDHGFRFCKTILNFPVAEENIKPHYLDCVHSDDIVVLNTRAPKNDTHLGGRRTVAACGSWLESRIFLAIEGVFATLARGELTLTDAMARKLKPGYENRGEIGFLQYRQRHGANEDTDLVIPSTARYTSLRQIYPDRYAQQDIKNKARTRTCAFLLRSGELWPGGPPLLTTFGMTGSITLAFNYLLRTREELRSLVDLDRPQFLMVEFDDFEISEQPTDLSFVDEWKHEVLINTYLDEADDETGT